MRRVSAVVGFTLVALLLLSAMGSVGCVGQDQYDALLMKNRSQEQLLVDKDRDIATLTERVNALMAARDDAQRMLEAKGRDFEYLKAENDRLHKAFEDLRAAYMKLVEGAPNRGGIPEKTALAIEHLAELYPGLFTFNRETGQLRFNSDITFDSGSNVVKENAKAALTKLAEILSTDDAVKLVVTVIGHTDGDRVKKQATIELLKGLGKSPNNQGLSEARAESVAGVLTAGGVGASRVVTQGKGDTAPIGDNNSAAGKAQNRRVEIFLTMGS